jgi:soluble lytic murein transglycosylase-like protein
MDEELQALLSSARAQSSAYSASDGGSTSIVPQVESPQLFSSVPMAQPSRLSMLGNDLLGGASSVFDTASLGAAKYAFAAPASLGAYMTNKYYGVPTDLGTEYDKALADVIQTQNAYKDAARSSSIPLTSIAGIPLSDIPASFATPLIKALGAVKYAPKIGEAATLGGQSLNLAGNVVKAGAQGALIGGVSEGSNTQGTPEEKMLAAWEGIKSGAALGGALAGAGSVLNALPATGKALQRSSIGARAGDYLKTSGRGQMQTSATGEAETLTQQALDSVIASGTLGASRNPGVMLQKVAAKSDAYEAELLGHIQTAEKAGVKVKTPDFFKTQRWIQEGGVPATSAQSYVDKIMEIQGAIKTLGKGSITYLQNQKKAYGTLYNSGNSVDDKFNRYIYNELQTSIEKVVPEAKGINKKIQELILTKPILARGVANNAAKNPLSRALQLTYTTSGAGLGTLVPLLGKGAGVVAGLGLTAANTALGRNLVGGLLQKASKTKMGVTSAGLKLSAIPADSSNKDLVDAAPIEDEADMLYRSIMEKTAPASSAPLVVIPTATPPKQDISLVDTLGLGATKAEAEDKPSSNKMARLEKASEGFNVAKAIAGSSKMVQAVSRVESNLKHASISSRGAIGIMQLMPTTAEELGVDPYDPRQNIKGGEKYLEQLRDRFKNDKLTFAAYNMGPNALRIAIRESGTRDWERIVKKLGVKSDSNPKGIPAQTIAYVPKVMKFYRR